jgi:hypothetical protein
MPDERVIDTTVLQKANAAITVRPGRQSRFARRLRLLSQIRDGHITVLISARLLTEYRKQVKSPRNDFVRLFFEILDDPGRAVYNWSHWSGREREAAQRCRFPREDVHVLRTATRPHATTIVTEEHRMLRADACLYRELRVHVRDITDG